MEDRDRNSLKSCMKGIGLSVVTSQEGITGLDISLEDGRGRRHLTSWGVAMGAASRGRERGRAPVLEVVIGYSVGKATSQ